MSPTVSNVLANGGAPSSGSNVTASWTPNTANQYLLSINAYVSTGSVAPVISSVTGNGVTWTLITSVLPDNAGADRSAVFLYAASGAGGSAGTITIAWSTVPTRTSWVLDEVVSADSGLASGTLPQAAVSGTSSAANPSATLGSSLQSGSITYAVAGFESSTGSLSAGSGYTALGTVNTQSLAWTLSEWDSAGSTSASASNTVTSNRHGIILIEIAKSVVSGTSAVTLKKMTVAASGFATSFVHKDTTIAQATTSVSSQAVTLSSAVGVGDLVLVVWASPAPDSDTVSDTAGNTWNTPVAAANNVKFAYSIIQNASPTGITITVTGGGSGTRFTAADRFFPSNGSAVYGSGVINPTANSGTSGNDGSRSSVPTGSLVWGATHTNTHNITYTAGSSNGKAATTGSSVGNTGGSGFTQYVPSAAGGTESITWTANTTVSGGGSLEAYFTVQNGVSGSGAVKLKKMTTSSSGIARDSGTSAVTLKKMIVAASGIAKDSSTGAATLKKMTVSVTGDVFDKGVSTAVLRKMTVSATGHAPVAGTATVKLKKMTTFGSGKAKISGTISVSLRKMTTSGFGFAPVFGTGDVAMPKMQIRAGLQKDSPLFVFSLF